METLDIVILVLVGLGGLNCLRVGFTRSVWGIAAISLGVFAASQLWREFALILQGVIKHEGISKWASVIAITAVVSIAVDRVFEQIQKIMRRGVLGWLDNVVGGLFGVAVSGVLIGLALILLNRYGGKAFQEAIATSRFAPTLLEVAHQVFNFGKEVIEKQAG
jgi:uncharacterized membrane protein required for colicin V production